MRNNSRFITTLSSLSIALSLAGCASKPVEPPPAPQKILSGDQMLRNSQATAQLGSRWQEGKQMVDKGQAMQRQGQAQIDQGQTMVEEGQKIMRETEEGYKTLSQ